MHGIIYLMKSNSQPPRAKFGHRTKSSAPNVIDEVHREYGNEFSCIATYDLGTCSHKESENIVKEIRAIINYISGNLKGATPEYYDISADILLDVLKSIAILRGDLPNFNEITKTNL